MGATTVTGTILGVDNAPQVGVYVTFRLKSVGTDSVATSTIDRDAISVITDASGDFSTTLWDNGDSGTTSVVEIKMPSGQRIDVIIPASTASIDIWDLIENEQVGGADPQLPTNQSLFMRKANNLSDLASASTSRTNLSVSSTAETALVANNLSDLASASAGRTNLGVAIGSDVQAHSTNLDSVNQDLATTDDVVFNKVTVVDALIGGDLFAGSGGLDIRNGTGSVAATFASGNSKNLDVQGALTLGTDLAIAEGGTGASTAAAARTNLSAQEQSTALDEIAALAPSQFDVMENTGSAWTAKDGQIATSLVVVRSASDLSGTLSSTKVYLIDGIIDMGSQSIEVPSGGLTIKGFSFDVSQLISTATSYTMFTSPVGGSGNLLGMDVAMEVSGTGSQVFNLVGDTGNEAIEFVRVNWNNCTSMGTMDGFRQGLETGTGRFGGTPNLTLKNPWTGGYFIDTSIVRSLAVGMTGALYQAGTGFTMASRFRSNQNIDLPASAAFIDFAPSNFTNPSTVQLDGCLISRGGAFDASDSNITPNIAASDLVSNWTENTGIDNTFEGGESTISTESTTTITTSAVFVDLAGTYTATGLQHFDAPSNGQLRHLGDSPINYRISGQMVLECTAGDDVALKIVIVRGGIPEDGKTQTREINNLVGGRNVAYFVLLDNVTLNKNDYVKLQVANVTTGPTSTDNITAELDSFFNVETR